MRHFSPALPYTTAILLYIPTYETIKGVRTKVFPADKDAIRLNCSFKTYGGTEITNNNIYSLIDTATVETWFRPDISSDCRIKVLATGGVYEVMNTPENIDMRNQFCRFKVRAIEGGA